MRDSDQFEDVQPTPAHYFIRLLAEQGNVHKVFTQNTDDLFPKCGIEESMVIHAHGHNGQAVCAICGAADSFTEMI